MIIQHNLQAMNANRQLNVSTQQETKSAEKLSSGYQINRSADDAAGLKISEKMRSQIRGLTRASQNCEEGDLLTKVADGALAEVHDLMQRQRELLVQAGNDTNQHIDKQAVQEELEALSRECNRIFDDTEFNHTKIFKAEPGLIDIGRKVNQDRQVISNDVNSDTKKKEVWIPVTDPQPTTIGPDKTTTTKVISSNSKYNETEKIDTKKEDGHHIYREDKVTTVESLIETSSEEKTITYEKIDDTKYTTLKSPEVAMKGRNGYLKVAAEAGNLELSCAMTQLGLKIDDNLIDINIYQSGKFKSTETVNTGKVINDYNMGKGITLRQTVELSGKDTYKIYYDIINTDTQDHEIDLRLAFDTMNMPGGFDTYAKSSNTSFTDCLKTDLAGIDISADANYGALGTIDNLYGNWDGTKITDGKTTSHHTGVGFWWEDKVVPPSAAGTPLRIGEITYGPIKITSIPYTETTQIDYTRTVEKVTDVLDQYKVIKPQYLDIQSGANSWQNIAIRQWNLSTDYLEINPGTDISAFSVDPSLDKMDRAINRISAVRSYYGAVSNELDYASRVDLNTAENTQSAESKIRDTDMAAVMVAYSKYNILRQAGTSVLAQANQGKQKVLDLLQ